MNYYLLGGTLINLDNAITISYDDMSNVIVITNNSISPVRVNFPGENALKIKGYYIELVNYLVGKEKETNNDNSDDLPSEVEETNK